MALPELIIQRCCPLNTAPDALRVSLERYGDKFSVENAAVAVDSLNVDWNAQAVRFAESYLKMSGFSCQGLIQQLSSATARGKVNHEESFANLVRCTLWAAL